MATLSNELKINFDPKNRRETYELLKEKLVKRWGLLPKSLGRGFSKYRKDNRVFDEESGTYIDRSTGLPWDDKALQTSFKSDFNTLNNAGKPINLKRIKTSHALLKAENRLADHDRYQTNLEGRLRRSLSDETLQGTNMYDREQAQLRNTLQTRVNKAREAHVYRPNAAELSILNRGKNQKRFIPSGMEVGQIVDGKFDQPALTVKSDVVESAPITAKATGETPVTITNEESDVQDNTAVTNEMKIDRKQPSEKIPNNRKKINDPTYKLTRIQQRLKEAGFSRDELQALREKHETWRANR